MIPNVKLALTDTVVQSEGNIVSDVNGEKVMLSIQNGKYYNLGRIGGAIWNAIETPTRLEQLVRGLTSEFEVDEAECKDQVLAFLEQLLDEGLVRVSNAA